MEDINWISMNMSFVYRWRSHHSWVIIIIIWYIVTDIWTFHSHHKSAFILSSSTNTAKQGSNYFLNPIYVKWTTADCNRDS